MLVLAIILILNRAYKENNTWYVLSNWDMSGFYVVHGKGKKASTLIIIKIQEFKNDRILRYNKVK